MSNIGVSYYGLENYEEALRYCKHCMMIIQQHFKDDTHPLAEHPLTILAMSLQRLHRFKEAAEYSVKILEIRMRKLELQPSAALASLLSDSGCCYHVMSELEMNATESKIYAEKAERAFKKSLECSGENVSVGLLTGYSNFLIQSNRLSESTDYILRVIASEAVDCNLYYPMMEKSTLTQALQDRLEVDGLQITINAQEYAYYLLLNHYEQFKSLCPSIEARELYLSRYISLIMTNQSEIGDYLLDCLLKADVN